MNLREILTEAQTLGFLGPGPIERHIEHAEGLAECLPAGLDRCLDLGSGGGIPGLVIAAGQPDLHLVLLDARKRRCAFLRRAVEQLEAGERVEVVEARAEEAARRPELRESIAAVVARSFSLPAVTAECATGFLRVGGCLVVSEPPDDSHEVEATPRWPETGLAELGFGPSVAERHRGASFAVTRKERSDDRWPRRVGIPAKRPLWAG